MAITFAEKEKFANYRILLMIILGGVLLFIVLKLYFNERDKVFLPQRVAHAGGALFGLTLTNSLEALNYNYQQGFRYFEIDLSFTDDNQLVCIHSWEGEKAIVSWPGKTPTRTEFLKAFEGDFFVPCTLESLMGWLTENGDAVIITDVKQREHEALELIASQFSSLLDQIVPQIYQPESFAAVREIGFKRIIWTLYRYRGSNRDVVSQIKNFTQPFALTFDTKRTITGLSNLIKSLDSDVVTFVYTVNSKSKLCLLKSEFNVSEIYTDFLHPDIDC